ncbi:MAG TPA: hypothetical protein VKP30_15940 [Polyangiaceae bacterium]|nr:hypothetical protein [Polyangiaceae bacterium]
MPPQESTLNTRVTVVSAPRVRTPAVRSRLDMGGGGPRRHLQVGSIAAILLLTGCSLLVDADVPARGAGSGASAGASHSKPTAGATATTPDSSMVGTSGGNSNRTSPVTVLGAANSGAAAGMGGIENATNSASSTTSPPSGGTGGAQQGNGGSTSSPSGGASSISTPSGGTTTVGSSGSPVVGGSPNAGGTASGTATSPTDLGCGLWNVLCDSFEQNTLGNADLAKRWTVNDLDNIATRSLGGASWEEATGVNGTGALHIHLVGTPASGVVGMLREDLVKDLKLTTSGVVQIDFDFRYSGAAFYPFGLFCGDNSYKITFNLDTNDVVEQGGLVTAGTDLPRATSIHMDWRIPNAHFSEFEHIRLVLNRGKATFSMAVGGQTILDVTDLNGNVSTGDCRLGIGVYYAASDEPMEFDAYFDNVRIRVD